MRAAPPLHLTVNQWRSKGGGYGQDRLDYVGPERFRVDGGPDTVAGTPGQTRLATSGEQVYESETGDDGSVTWRQRRQDPRHFYLSDWLVHTLLALPDDCPRWRHLGMDSVGPFIADHLDCEKDKYKGVEYWVDRATHLVVRLQSADDSHCGRSQWPWPCSGTAVSEVVELSFGPTPDERLRLPEGAVVEALPTPRPGLHSDAETTAGGERVAIRPHVA